MLEKLSRSSRDSWWALDTFQYIGRSVFRFLLCLPSRPRAQKQEQRRSTYRQAATVLAKYQVLLTNHEKPSTEFHTQVSRVDTEIADSFSETAYQAWRKAESFFTSDGSLPLGKQEYDFELARQEALASIRKELFRSRKQFRRGDHRS